MRGVVETSQVGRGRLVGMSGCPSHDCGEIGGKSGEVAKSE